MKREVTAIYVGKQSLSRNATNLHDYAQASHLYELLSQAGKILLRKNGISSGQVIHQFLQQCNRGEHVLLKSYGSFSKSPICKICFLYNFIKIFEVDQTQRNGLDYYQLSRLLCSDFPRQFIQKAVALLLPKQQPQLQMFRVLPPKKIQQAIYLFMIYAEYLENISKYFEQEQQLDFLEAYRVIKQEDIKNIRQLSKPPFAVMSQCILNLMKQKGLLAKHEAPLIFITEENIQDFIRDAETNHPETKIRLEQILQGVLESQEFIELVEQNLNMFDNGHPWSVESHKILSAKQPSETPLNVKKKGTKK